MFSVKESLKLYYRILAFADEVNDPRYPPDELGRFALIFWRDGLAFTVRPFVYNGHHSMIDLREQLEKSGWACYRFEIDYRGEDTEDLKERAKKLLRKMEQEFSDYVVEISRCFPTTLTIERPKAIPAIDDLPTSLPCYPIWELTGK